MKYWVVLFCVGCGRSFPSGEYVVSYSDATYGLDGLSINVDPSNGEITSSFEQPTTIENCPTKYQSFNPSSRLRVDSARPSVTELQSQNISDLSLTSTDCSFWSDMYDVDFEEPVFSCFGGATEIFEFDNNGAEESVELAYSVEHLISWNSKTKSVTGLVMIGFGDDLGLSESTEAYLQTLFDPHCVLAQEMTLELAN